MGAKWQTYHRTVILLAAAISESLRKKKKSTFMSTPANQPAEQNSSELGTPQIVPMSL